MKGRQARTATAPLCLAVACAALVGAACATGAPPPTPVVGFEQKMSWILRLEDRRILRDPTQPAPHPPGRAALATAPPIRADLLQLVQDPDPRVRRRAALAVGRVGLADGARALEGLLADPDPELRQIAVFALGLLGDSSAVTALVTALGDPSPLVQGRAAEALGLLGEASAARAIGLMVAAHMQLGEVARIGPDDLSYPLDDSVEAFRLGVYALARLRAYDALAAAVLEPDGRPRVRWWPVAYALQRTEDSRAFAALASFVRSDSRYGRAFAARGLGALKNPAAIDFLLPLLDPRRSEREVLVATVRALASLGGDRAAPALLSLAADAGGDPAVRLEAVVAIGTLKAAAAVELILDVMADPWPAMRAAALRSLAEIDLETLTTVLSGLDPDEHWSVRAARASALVRLGPDIAVPGLTQMLGDPDKRVIPAVLTALVRLRAPNAVAAAIESLKDDDPVVRMAGANSLAELKPAGGGGPLAAAYRFGQRDATYVARAAALAALARYGDPLALETLREALSDKDWAVRVRAAELLQPLDPGGDFASAIRPAPSNRSAGDFDRNELVSPSVSPHVFIETEKGTIQIELLVLDAPLTADSVLALARKGFFDGLSFHRVVSNFVVQGGDPRGDGEGGPGFTVRDELNPQPYLRGTVGMALDWRDTGGSQFFITHSPQPHLDARYTVFGRVIAGMDVVDRLAQWDRITRVRTWDGAQLTGEREAGRR